MTALAEDKTGTVWPCNVIVVKTAPGKVTVLTALGVGATGTITFVPAMIVYMWTARLLAENGMQIRAG